MSFLRRCLEVAPANSATLSKLSSLLVQGHQWLGQPDQARVACRPGRARFPEDTELLYREALLCQEAPQRRTTGQELAHGRSSLDVPKARGGGKGGGAAASRPPSKRS